MMSLNNLPISRKLMLAFAAVFLAIGAMGVAVFVNLQAENHAGNDHSAANQIARTTAAAEFALARVENSYRGFLVSNDGYYIDRVQTHRTTLRTQLEELRGLSSPEAIAEIERAEKAADVWFENIVEPGRLLALNPATRNQALVMVGHDGVADGYMEKIEDAIAALKAINQKRLDASRAAQARATKTAMASLLAGLAAAGVIALIVGWLLSRAIGKPVIAMTGAMRELAAGDTAVDVPGVGRKDEVGQMADAVTAFKDAAIANARLEAEAVAQRQAAEAERMQNDAARERAAREQAGIVTALAEGLDHLRRGNLTFSLTETFPADYVQLQSDFNDAMAQLKEAMTIVAGNVSAIQTGAGEISQAADDLSRRTEQQAASLEETAAALEEITATVNKTAHGAKQAADVVIGARGDAETSGAVVREAVTAMGAIEQSAQQISQIIGVIDEIAFQTNLLALNAGVEAARAGDAGRGFAVVASEVRALAQRSADAAKQIKALITTSSTQVGSGVRLVGQTGEALQRIVDRVVQIDGLVTEIAASAFEQANGLQEVNTAVNQMDQVTQQNAAMVEQSTAASHGLAQEAQVLAQSISRFDIGAARTRRTAPPAARANAGPRTVAALKATGRGGAALAQYTDASHDGWEEF